MSQANDQGVTFGERLLAQKSGGAITDPVAAHRKSEEKFTQHVRSLATA